MDCLLEGSAGEDAKLLDRALEDRQVVIPVVLSELLSDPKIPAEVAETLSEVPLMEIEFGYWMRARMLWSKILAKRHKARLGDASSPKVDLMKAFCSLAETEIFGHLPRLPGSIFFWLLERTDLAMRVVNGV